MSLYPDPAAAYPIPVSGHPNKLGTRGNTHGRDNRDRRRRGRGWYNYSKVDVCGGGERGQDQKRYDRKQFLRCHTGRDALDSPNSLHQAGPASGTIKCLI